MATFVTRLKSEPGAPGIRLAVKDVIDVAGTVTTAGSPALAHRRAPAPVDAACVETARAAGAVIVGKTNLHELALGTTGVNGWYGTPVNPLRADLVPGGSSSGSAVAVATGYADVALGTDTGGSIRIPAACCGVAGLKTTRARVPLTGVTPLAPSLDTVGPLATDVAGLVTGMALIEPAFVVAPPDRHVGRIVGLPVHPAVTAAIDEALAAAGLEVVDVPLDGWAPARRDHATILVAEAWTVHGSLLAGAGPPLGPDVAGRLLAGRQVTAADRQSAVDGAARWGRLLRAVLGDVGVLALPTLPHLPPPLSEVRGRRVSLNALTSPVNLAGLPALSLPVPMHGSPLPGSLQLIGPPGSEAQLCGLGMLVEEACAGG